MDYYIASCVFTTKFPELSMKIQNYVTEHYGLKVVRCCVGGYKVKEFEDKIDAESPQDRWRQLPQSADFTAGDRVYSLCHNCNNIIEEMHPDVEVHSIWERIAEDSEFRYPDSHGMIATVQDCWRARERKDEQNAVRTILAKMNIEYVEAPVNHEQTDFCGVSLYRPQPPRNPALAPKHYVDQAKGLFRKHSLDEQKKIMTEHCSRYLTKVVICYCHYCLEGLLLGGVEGYHLAQLLFDDYQ